MQPFQRLIQCSLAVGTVVIAAVAIRSQERTPTHEWRYFGGDKAFTRYSPADQINKLRVGQNVVLKLDKRNGTAHRVTARIFAVEPEVLSPQAAQKRFDPGVPFSNIGEPKAVALARLDPPNSSAFLLNYRGDSIDAWVQTDSKPIVSLFPLMGGESPNPSTSGKLSDRLSVRVWRECLTSAKVRSSSYILCRR